MPATEPVHLLAADYSWWFHLFALVSSGLLVAFRALQLAGGYSWRLAHERLVASLATIVVAVLIVDGLTLVADRGQVVWGATVRVGVVVLAVGFVWAMAKLAAVACYAHTHGEAERAWRRRGLSLGLLCMYLLLAGWSAKRYYTTVAPVIAEPPPAQLPGQHVPSKRYVAMTDAGTEIPLYRWNSEAGKDLKTITSMIDMLLGDQPSVIQREDPDDRSNCHGWVFTRGRFLLTGNDVERILADHEYKVVEQPQVGDLVIYRNLDGGIVHTGLVVGILADKSVIVESKWSVGGRYLHSPEGQPYSTRFDYYRTQRSQHTVAIRFRNREHMVDEFRSAPRNINPGAPRKANVKARPMTSSA